MAVILTILINMKDLMILLVIKLRPLITRVVMRLIRLRIRFHGQHLFVGIWVIRIVSSCFHTCEGEYD